MHGRVRTRLTALRDAGVRTVDSKVTSDTVRILVDYGVIGELRDQALRRIPVYSPEWTNLNASDPGVTMVELFAFLGENLLYRFNQIPEPLRLKFAALLSVRPKAASRCSRS